MSSPIRKTAFSKVSADDTPKTCRGVGDADLDGITRNDNSTLDENSGVSVDGPVSLKHRTECQTFASGDMIDHFALIHPLGEGGFGQVWLAKDTRLHREVAIKLPHRHLRPASVEARRFHREAETAAKLTHPNLVPILDAVLRDDVAYIVSEYCPGPTLSQWMHRQTHLPTARVAVSIVAQLASGLDVAHQLGLIHRDIKPSNIILTAADTDRPVPRLTDFGLARGLNDVSETRTGACVGSGPYMSPEQASGEIDTHGPHSDVHALGVLLYELLTGRSPFASSNEIDTIRQILETDPPSVRVNRPEISRDISAVCQRCLEKSPARRYRDAGELLKDLDRLLDGRAPAARPIGRFGRTIRWADRNRTLSSMIGVAAASVLLAIAGLALYAIAARRHATRVQSYALELRDALDTAKTQRSEAMRQRAVAVDQRELAEKTHLRWRQTSYTSDIASAFLRFDQGYYGDVRQLLDRQIPDEGEIDLRTFEWWLLEKNLTACYSFLGRHENGGTECLFYTDESTLLTAGNDGNLIFWDTATETEQRRISGLENRLSAVGVMPDGDLIIAGAQWPLFGRALNRIDPLSGRIRNVLHGHSTTIEWIEVSDDASVIASGSRYSSIRCWITPESRSVDHPNGMRNESFGLTGDGKFLITGQHERKMLQVRGAASGEVLREKEFKFTIIRSIAANQNAWIAFAGFNRKGFGIAAVDDLDQSIWIESKSQAGAIEFAANDRFLALADHRAGVELFEVNASPEMNPMLPDVRSIAHVSGKGGVVEGLAVGSDGDVFSVAEDGSVERFSPRKQNRSRDFLSFDDASHVVLSNDGRHGWVLDNSGRLFAVDGTLQKNSRRLISTGLPKILSVSVGADGRRLAVMDIHAKLHVYDLNQDCVLIDDSHRVYQMPHSDEAIDRLEPIVFSRSGRYIATTVDGCRISVWDLDADGGGNGGAATVSTTPMCFRHLTNNLSCFQFSLDEKLLMLAGNSGIELIELETNNTRLLIPTNNAVRCIAFVPDNESVMVGTLDGAIVNLNLKNGSVQYALHGVQADGEPTPSIGKLCFYSDGSDPNDYRPNRLVSLTHSGELQFWDLDQRLQLGGLSVCDAKPWDSYCSGMRWIESTNELITYFHFSPATDVYRWSPMPPDGDSL